MWHEDQACCSLIQRHQGFLDLLPFARNSPSPPSTRQQYGNSQPLSSLLSSSPNGRGREKQQNTEKGTSLCFLGFQFYCDEPRGKSKLLVKDLETQMSRLKFHSDPLNQVHCVHSNSEAWMQLQRLRGGSLLSYPVLPGSFWWVFLAESQSDQHRASASSLSILTKQLLICTTCTWASVEDTL